MTVLCLGLSDFIPFVRNSSNAGRYQRPRKHRSVLEVAVRPNPYFAGFSALSANVVVRFKLPKVTVNLSKEGQYVV